MSQQKKEKLIDWDDVCGYASSDEETAIAEDLEMKQWDCTACKAFKIVDPWCPVCGDEAWWSQFIIKVAKNRKVMYGDGGHNDMKWDIYYVPSLPVDDEQQIITLKKELLSIAKKNNDWRENEPILNIIDPDLYVHLLYNRINQEKKNKNKNKNKNKEVDDDDDYYYDNKRTTDFNDDNWYDNVHKQFNKVIEINKNYENRYEHYKDIRVQSEKNLSQFESFQQKGYFVRRTYQWLATEFNEVNFNNNTKESQIKIISAIHNISPRSNYCHLYDSIEYLFTQMLPLFNRFEIFSKRKSSNFQVIVKSQRYEIDPMTGYAGHWHVEGLTENIVLAGLYYFERDVKLKGGDLRFRNKVQPEDWYMEKKNMPLLVHNVPTIEGSAVVFDNINLVHRVRMLKNKENDKKKRYRSFIAFFIVDPDNKIKSTKDIPCLKREIYMNNIHSVTQLPKSICELICMFGNCGMTFNKAKELRNRDIFIRKNTFTKGRWASGCYGNSGEKIWFPLGHCSPGKCEDLSWRDSTHSELLTSVEVAPQ